MKLVSFQSSDGPKLGASIDDKVLDLHATYQVAAIDDALPTLLGGMIPFLEGGQRAFDVATHAINVAESNPEKAVWSTDALLSPIPNPKKPLLLAANYASHIEEGGGTALSKLETTPRIFMKPPTTTMVAHGDSIITRPTASLPIGKQKLVSSSANARHSSPRRGIRLHCGSHRCQRCF